MTAYVWCDVCGKKIDEGETAFIRERTDADVFEELELEESATTEVWQCRQCKEEWEGQSD